MISSGSEAVPARTASQTATIRDARPRASISVMPSQTGDAEAEPGHGTPCASMRPTLLRVALDQLVVALDQPDHSPEPEPPEIGVSRVNRGLDPVELGSEPSGRSFPSFHGWTPRSGVTMRRTRSDLPSSASLGRRAPSQGVSRSRRPRTAEGSAFVTLDGRYHMVERIAAGGHGRGLPGPRRRPGARGRDQGAAPLPRRRSRVRGPVPARGPRRRRASRTPTSSTSTTGAPWTACTTWSWSTCAARASGTS